MPLQKEWEANQCNRRCILCKRSKQPSEYPNGYLRIYIDCLEKKDHKVIKPLRSNYLFDKSVY